MRTTLDIDEDVLLAVKERSRHEHRSAGRILSELARRGLADQPAATGDELVHRDGFWILPSRGGIVTNDLIDRIRDEEGI